MAGKAWLTCAGWPKTLQETNNKQLGLVKEYSYKWGGRQRGASKCKREKKQTFQWAKKTEPSTTTNRFFFFYCDTAAVITSVFRVVFQLTLALANHSTACSSRWSGSSCWTSLWAAVGTGAGCCRKTGCFLRRPEFRPLSDSFLHPRSLLSRPVWGAKVKSLTFN